MLTVKKVESLKDWGKYADSQGLYLNINKGGKKSWIYRYQLNGRRREVGLGSITLASLKEAREKAADGRKLHAQGIDPKAQWDKDKYVSDTSDIWTFDRCSKAYITAHEAKWKNEKHISQWRNTLEQYASPVFGHLAIDKIDIELVLQVIEPMWKVKTETATRVRQRIETVIAWATVKGYRKGANPASWKGNLDMLLPARSKIQAVKHHSALPYKDLSKFMQWLSMNKSLSSQALQLTILTACRTSEVLGASWNEFDLEEKIWTIPANRMKSKREHRVPITNEIEKLLTLIPRVVGSDWAFPSKNNKHLSNMAMLTLLKKSKDYSGLTVHGFRSTFRDWAAEVSSYARELAESALAHVLGNQTEAAYQRGDLLAKRREMMTAWSDYCLSELKGK